MKADVITTASVPVVRIWRRISASEKTDRLRRLHQMPRKAAIEHKTMGNTLLSSGSANWL